MMKKLFDSLCCRRSLSLPAIFFLLLFFLVAMLLTGCETKKQSEEVSEIKSIPVAPVVAQTDEETAFNPDTDLPPAGTRSLFDYILKESGGLPFPFEKLLETISSYSEMEKHRLLCYYLMLVLSLKEKLVLPILEWSLR